MLKFFFATLSNEFLKLRRSTIFWITLALACFIALMLGFMMFLVMHPDILPPGIMRTKIDLAEVTADWPSFAAFLDIVSGAFGIVIFGFAASWVFGREFVDRTVKDLLAQPVSRSVIVWSKLAATMLWSALIGVVIFAASFPVGALVGLPGWTPSLLPGFAKVYFAAMGLGILLCPPIAWIATAGRGYLPAIGCVIFLMAISVFASNAGWGDWFPWSIPMMAGGVVEEGVAPLSAHSYIVIAVTAALGCVGTLLHWKYADQDK